ncbi:cytochrome c oxidase-assembly factor COX16 [Kwoniella mangroviensis CBS 8886]|uniref:uncharacterized protein n=1 Tax=Kwoniella mangroviensis CBS 8507 TaxID=1296122 RepID=UPI00080D3529|nr:cytochrome c oxidase-assembly factor COX16 [Kwoniella mangroviensis CBS 8507]OCF66516.1 cytochrome c oxidase-assembly factor COX16 [Kwoniella mangroviensis CBS 8507]OCF74337.1 cytochrome c oxidase-assembly factor COX16 [Kwoniella mangroviensis CBS 8886]
MTAFSSRPLNKTTPTFLTQIRKHPFVLFGLPFVGIIVASSFALSSFTQTRYDYQQSKVQSVGAEEGLGMRSDRRKVDLKEEYYRLNAPSSQISSLSSPDSALNADLAPSPSIPRKPKKSKFSMSPVSQDDYEPVRVPRPEGVPEWGGGRGGEEAPLKGQRKTDRWV